MTGTEYENLYKKEVLSRDGKYIIKPWVWIMFRWEVDNGFRGPWDEREKSECEWLKINDPKLYDYVTRGYKDVIESLEE